MTVSGQPSNRKRGMDHSNRGYFTTNFQVNDPPSAPIDRSSRQKRKSCPDTSLSKRAKSDISGETVYGYGVGATATATTSSSGSFSGYGSYVGGSHPRSCPAAIGQVVSADPAAAGGVTSCSRVDSWLLHHQPPPQPAAAQYYNYESGFSAQADPSGSDISSQDANFPTWSYSLGTGGDAGHTTWEDPGFEITDSNILQQVQQCLDFGQSSSSEPIFSATTSLKAIDSQYHDETIHSTSSPETLTDLSNCQPVQSSTQFDIGAVTHGGVGGTAAHAPWNWNRFPVNHVETAPTLACGITASSTLVSSSQPMAAAASMSPVVIAPALTTPPSSQSGERRRRHADRKREKSATSTVVARPSSCASLSAINQPDTDGDLPLHIAVAAENVSAVARLIGRMVAAKVSLDTRNNMQQTALHVAAMTGHQGIVRRLIQHGSNCRLVDRNGNNAVHLAVQSAPLETLRVILQSTRSVEALGRYNYEGFTPLHLAVLRRDVDVVSLLVASGADCNCLDRTSGRTPLFHAISISHEEMVRCLMSHGANVNLPNYAGVMPLVVATDRRQKNISSLLIANGATINYRDDLS